MSYIIKDQHGNPRTHQGQKLLGADSSEAVVKDVSAQRRTYTMCISSENPDRSGEIIIQSGIDFGNYNLNGVILWAHHLDEIPCARCVEHWMETKDGIAKTFMTIQHSETDDSMKVFNAVKSGFLKASSIGFISRRSEKISQKGKNRPSIFGEPLRHLEIELIEVSICSVGMSADALVQMNIGGLNFFKSCGDCARCTCNGEDDLDELERDCRMQAALDALDDIDDDFADDDLDLDDLNPEELRLAVQLGVRQALRSLTRKEEAIVEGELIDIEREEVEKAVRETLRSALGRLD